MNAAQISVLLTRAKRNIRSPADTAAVIATFSYEPEPVAGALATEEGLSAAFGTSYGVLLGALAWAALLLWLGH